MWSHRTHMWGCRHTDYIWLYTINVGWDIINIYFIIYLNWPLSYTCVWFHNYSNLTYDGVYLRLLCIFDILKSIRNQSILFMIYILWFFAIKAYQSNGSTYISTLPRWTAKMVSASGGTSTVALEGRLKPSPPKSKLSFHQCIWNLKGGWNTLSLLTQVGWDVTCNFVHKIS